MTAIRMPTGILEEVGRSWPASLSEATLFRGHRIEGETYVVAPEPVACDCECGTPIVSISRDDEDIVLAMRSHQRLPEHQLYRLRYGGS